MSVPPHEVRLRTLCRAVGYKPTSIGLLVHVVSDRKDDRDRKDARDRNDDRDDVQGVQLEELGEVEHEQDPDTRDARPSAAVVSTDFFRLSR